MMKRRVFLCLQCCVLLAGGLGAQQQIVTAERLLELVSDRYAGFEDYEARVAIRSGGTDMHGSLVHKQPDLLRIDFTTPSDQVIVFNGEMLTVYLPEYRAILTQNVRSSSAGGANLATGQGLALLRRNFTAAFISGPAPVPLDGYSGEPVIKLRLTRRYGTEGFREIIMSVAPDSLLILRMDGTTVADGNVRFDFSDIRTNQDISERRFIYDSPASANIYNDFLFRDTE